MKNQFILILILLSASGCGIFRPGASSTDNSTTSGGTYDKYAQVKFLNSISTGDEADKTGNRSVSLTTSFESPAGIGSGEKFNNLQFKYAILTNMPVERLTNQKLLDFMDEWYGVPYHYGGSDKDGIDCSAFASLLLSSVYQVNDLPRMSRDQYKASRRIPKNHLREGDLVFFHTLGRGHTVTHVGVYLFNSRFIHASIAGVQISDLGSGYYASHFVGGGRVIPDAQSN